MVTDVYPEFDIGPLSWVQGEIDQSLVRALESLEAFDSATGDTSPLQRARTHFRQAAGAIHMVGLDALQAYTDEIEQQLERLGRGVSKPEATAITALIVRACRKLRDFLAELVHGAPLVPFSLYTEYEAMQRSRGVKITHPADLFCPDLSIRRDDSGPRHTVQAAQFPAFLIRERRLYERGLLAWLRGDIKGADAMREAAENIEVGTPQHTVRTFWWMTTALFDAVREHAVADTFLLKHLLARIDLQIRRLIDGSGSVAERLQRETLYFLAISAPVSERIRQVQEHYRLKALLPAGEADGGPAVDTLTTLRTTHEMQGLAAEAKNLWQRLMSGQIDQYPKFRDSLQALREKAALSAYSEMQTLFAELLKGSEQLTVQDVPEPVAMEYATALLFAEDVFAQQGVPIAELPENIRTIGARVSAALANRSLPPLDVPALAKLSERAQNRMLLAQVAQDIQANLRHMEQELDAFFRDNNKRAGLKDLARDGREISGALRILGLENADRLLSACMAQIAHYIEPETALDHKGFELLAESLSALGFYIEALEQQRPQREEMILPLLERQQERQRQWEGAAVAPTATDADAVPQAAPAAEEAPAAKVEPELAPALSIEASVERDISRLQVLGQQLRQNPQASVLRRNIEKLILTLGDDAKLVGNAVLVDKVKAIRERIEADDFAEIPTLLSTLSETATVVVTPSAETQRLMQVDASELDAELLDIYLQEAIEVLDGVNEHRAQLVKHPHDHEALRTVRRAFHTLKGSGRMVGLAELGELAYDVEKIHNQLLEKGYPATPAVLAMMDMAEREFRHWVNALIKNKTVSPDPSELYAAINAVAHEIDSATPQSTLPDDETAQKKNLLTTAPKSTAETVTSIAPEKALEEALETAPEIEVTEDAPETRWETWELSPPLLEAITVVDATAEEEEFEPSFASPVVPIAIEKADTETSAAPRDDQGEISLEINIASLRKTTDDARRQVKPVAATEQADGSVSLQVDWAKLRSKARSKEAEEKAKPVAETAPVLPKVAPLPTMPETEVVAAIATAPAEETPPVAGARKEVRIGEVVLSKVLFDLFTEENEQHWSVLNHEQDLMRLDALCLPSSAMVRAAHTLAGAHLAVGFPEVAKVAKALELLLIAVEECGRQGEMVTSRTVPIVARAIAGLRLFFDRIRQCQAFAPAELREAENIEAEIEALRTQIVAALADAHAKAQKAQETPGERPAVAEQTPTLPEKLPEASATTPAAAPTTAPTPSAERPAPSAPPIAPKPSAMKPTEESAGDADAELLSMRDEIDAQLLPLFLEEGSELFSQTGELLRHLRQSPEDQALQLKLKRNLHTFKGSARMVGAMRLGELAHRMETSLAEGAGADTSEAYFDALENHLDRIDHVFGRLRAGDVNVALPWLADQTKGEDTVEDEKPAEAVAKIDMTAPVAPWLPAMRPTAQPTAQQPATPAVTPTSEEGQLRISAAKIDRLVNEAGEIIIARTRAEGELRGLKSDLLELTNSVIRLRNHVRVIEIEAESQIQAQLEQMQNIQGDFDPLEFDRYTRLQELTRSIAEGVNDVSTVQQALLAHLDKTSIALLSQARVSRDVQQALFSVRTVPFSSVTERLYRILRMLSKELQKRANLEIEGAHHGLDRAVLERLVGPLEHLLRNALAHGIEPPEARRAAGKPETGEITIAVRQIGNEIVIAFSDDGMGLDPETIRNVAIEKGLLSKDETVSEAKLFELILEPGFTTSKKVTQVSGRGLGTDIVRNEVVSLGGRVEVSSVAGRGATFTLYLPLTVAVAQTVLIRGTQNRSWAIPVMMVEQVEHVTEKALAQMYETGEVERRGQRYPFYYFDRLVERGDTVPETRRYNPVIFLRTLQGQVAIHVDHMIGNQEVVIKNAGTQLARVTGLSSATILGDGEIVLIVNPIQLSQRSHIPPLVAESTVQKLEEVTAPLVLIVDDSLTIRKVTSRLMTREGYAVETAKDGFEALQAVNERRPDIILLDIEMPKMDGFEFAKLMKGDAKTRDIPIIMITSRTADKHRMRARELGVDAYLGKPYQEEELLEAIQKSLALATVH
ncbi:MAG: Hpt domain-containing protein [Proteobacteria bacterium]|nr:Hpt domain-containing protein [Pseudomonadota bacterium]MCL2307692.1 Hpt domain-containing protein [Pseudomonadota bacterium]